MNYILRIIGVGCYPVLSEDSGDLLSFSHSDVVPCRYLNVSQML